MLSTREDIALLVNEANSMKEEKASHWINVLSRLVDCLETIDAYLVRDEFQTLKVDLDNQKVEFEQSKIIKK